MIACPFIQVGCGWTLMEMPFKPMVVGFYMITRLRNTIGMEKTEMDQPTKFILKGHSGSVEILF
jgi:hypothetical protein